MDSLEIVGNQLWSMVYAIGRTALTYLAVHPYKEQNRSDTVAKAPVAAKSY